MSNRERWVVYPLLFFSLAMGFKSAYLNPISFQSQEIKCKRLQVEVLNGSPASSIGVASVVAEQAAKISASIRQLQAQAADDSADVDDADGSNATGEPDAVEGETSPAESDDTEGDDAPADESSEVNDDDTEADDAEADDADETEPNAAATESAGSESVTAS